MRVMDLFPPTTVASDPFRNVDTLSAREWGELMATLADLRDMYDAAHDQANEEWGRRWPRENYATAEDWVRDACEGSYVINENGEFVRGDSIT